MRTLYVPALLTGIEHPAKACVDPNNKKFQLYQGKYDPVWFTPLSMFFHEHVLVSYYYSGKIPNYREKLRIRDDVTLWADSGGYSLFTQGGDLKPKDVLKWQEANADIAFSLDIPPAKSENTTRCSPGRVTYDGIEEFTHKAKLSQANNVAFESNRTTDSLKIYNVIHGYNKDTLNIWWDIVTKTDFEGYATGMKPTSNVLRQALCLMFLYDKGVRERIHLLGVSGITVIPMLVWASQYIDKISFDSTSYGYGSRTRAYVYPDRIRYYTHFGRKFDTKKIPMTKIYCNCPVCKDFDTPEYFLQNGVTWPGMLLSLHNLWAVKKYVEELETTLIVEKDKEKFLSLVKHHTGNWADKTMLGIQFVEDCITLGFDKSYEIYFDDRKRYTANKLI